MKDRYKRGNIKAEKSSVIPEEVIDPFHKNVYITMVGKLSFHLEHVRILGSLECGKTRCGSFKYGEKLI